MILSATLHSISVDVIQAKCYVRPSLRMLPSNIIQSASNNSSKRSRSSPVATITRVHILCNRLLKGEESYSEANHKWVTAPGSLSTPYVTALCHNSRTTKSSINFKDQKLIVNKYFFAKGDLPPG